MSRFAGLLLAISALGCTRPNPAFDDLLGGSEVGGGSEVSSGDPSSTGDPTDDPLDTSDTDDPETTASDTETEDECDFQLRPPLRLVVRMGEEDCPASLDEKVTLLLDLETVNAEQGMATGSRCADSDCKECQLPGYAIGAPGFAGLAQTWTALANLARNGTDTGLCIDATAGSLVDMVDDACIYESMGIRDNTVEHGPIFIGQTGAAPLTWVAAEVLGLQIPERSNDSVVSCSCASVFATDEDALECCVGAGAGAEPSFFALQLMGVEVGVGESGLLPIQQVPWIFHVLQAQQLPTCDKPMGQVDVSWAMTREN